MISVHVIGAHLDAAAEFFELFKTAWMPAVSGRRSRVLLCDRLDARLSAELTLLYSSRQEAIDRDASIDVEEIEGVVDADWNGNVLPLYGGVARFAGGHDGDGLTHQAKPLCHTHRTDSGVVVHIGYDLFREVGYLLTQGQPASRAMQPTLEMHIDFLRQRLIRSRIGFVEIPPRPAGTDFVCCLTHDLDFFGIRRHRMDSTLAGFLVRACFVSLIDLFQRRRLFAEVIQNWLAVLSLPFVYLKMLPDFWQPFADYTKADLARATFFVVPFKGRPGAARDGTVNPLRAVPYQASEIRADLITALASGNEIGLHGIDAWRGESEGRAESDEIAAAAGRRPRGVRMHWLYFAEDSPEHLEAAGFEYDSTWGYNEAVGYRAGTSQVFRLPTTRGLLELPLSIMDTALFYSHRMHLGYESAMARCREIISNARRFGGTVVVNWHDRSLAPERLWGRAYKELQHELASSGRVWFATACDAVEWFRWRRSIGFAAGTDGVDVTITTSQPPHNYPAAVLVHSNSEDGRATVREVSFDGRAPLSVRPS
jgi:hypothetical protein